MTESNPHMTETAPMAQRFEASDSDGQSSAIAHVSHEMRSPIHMILGLVELLVSEGDLSNQQRNRLETIGRVADSLSLMLDDLLDFSKISAGEMELANDAFSPAATADSVGQSFNTQAAEKGLRFSIVVDPSLPLKVLGDSNRLRQVLTNLVSNAIKYTDSGLVRLDISPVGADRIQFSVVDTGPGIPEDAQPTIFMPYQQATVEHSSKGTGLGLAISHKLVELMGGELDFTTSPKGTTFWCDIPFKKARRATDYEQQAPPTVGVGEVLVVDDSSVNRMLASSQLERLGYTAQTATGGEEALEMMNSTSFAAVLMDWHMPGMDGLEATKAWREQEEGDQLPIIMVTASVMAGDREACLEAGASDYLSKPASVNDIAAVLSKWIDQQDDHSSSPVESDDQLVQRLIDQLGSKEVVLPILEAYVSTLPEYSQAAIDARSSGDTNSISRAAHTIRPAAEMIGETRLAETSQELETVLKNDPDRDFSDLVDRFVSDCEQSGTRITSVIEQLRIEQQG